jgi:hypothetical protein
LQLWLAIGLPIIVTLGLIVGGAVWAVLPFFVPPHATGWIVREPQCQTDPTSQTNLLQLDMSPAISDTDAVSVSRLSGENIEILAMSSLPPGQSLDSLDASQRLALRTSLDEHDTWVYSVKTHTKVIVELASVTEDGRASLASLQLLWIPGERGLVQDVPVGLDISPGHCQVRSS